MMVSRRSCSAVAAWFLAAVATACAGPATSPSARPLGDIEPSQKMTAIATSAVRAAQAEHPDWKLKDADIAVTLVDLRDPQHAAGGSFRGEAAIYPASVIKLFYLAYAHRLLADAKLADSPELRRGLHDMIVDSNNDATAYIVDAVTDAPNGAELPPEQMKAWADKRNAANRYYASLGYVGINVCQKAYAEGPYGRERIFLGTHYENRNALTTDATARLLADIVRYRAVDSDHSRQMMNLLQRNMEGKAEGPDDQAHGFTALALSPEYHLFSKAGWTSTARHDAAYVESPDGLKFVLVTFTTGHANQREIIPSVARSVMRQLRGGPAASDRPATQPAANAH